MLQTRYSTTPINTKTNMLEPTLSKIQFAPKMVIRIQPIVRPMSITIITIASRIGHFKLFRSNIVSFQKLGGPLFVHDSKPTSGKQRHRPLPRKWWIGCVQVTKPWLFRKIIELVCQKSQIFVRSGLTRTGRLHIMIRSIE